jgi:hypothetical protein
MPIQVQYKIEGLDQLKRKLGELPNRVQNKVIRQSLTKGARIVARSIKDDAPVAKPKQHISGVDIRAGGGKGLLKKSIGQVIRTRRGTDMTYAVIGAKRGLRRLIGFTQGSATGLKRRSHAVYMNPSRYAHLMERETQFQSRASASSQSAALSKIASSMGEGIEAEARKQ